ncbi:hypothetical protein ABT061_41860 [Streptosporangium sp. NPDC002544]|uniref:hypothetical protein n=1 Tax=Streptosporangium sp. NPDC002544 TaxID=3154538 RepID=UPI00331B90CE
MPRSARSFPVRLGAMFLLATLSLTACGEKQPTAAEAGETLKAHILKLLKEVNAKNIQITDPGGKDIPCGEGRAKRTFAAIGKDTAQQTKPEILNTQLLGALNEFADYRMANSESNALRATSESAKTSLELGSKEIGQYAIQGETNCLNQS